MNLDVNAATSGSGFESVGQSLLAQKQADASRVEKKNKRQQQMMGALGLLSFGASMYRGQTAKRAQELESAQAFSLGNVKSRTNAIKTIASLEQMTRGKSYEEILTDPTTFDNTKSVLRPLITEQMKSRFNEQRYKELPATLVDSLETRATRNILEELLKKDDKGPSRLESVSRRMFGDDTILDENGKKKYVGSALFQGSTEEEKIATAFNLTPEAFEASQKRMYADYLGKLQNSDGVFNIGNLLNFAGVGKPKKGSVNIFKRIDPNDEDLVLGEGTLQMMLDATKIQTDIIPIIQDAIVGNVSEDYSSAIQANGENIDTTEGMAVNAIRNAIINEDDIDDGNYNSPHLGEFVTALAISDDMEEILQEMDRGIFDEGDGTITKDSVAAQPLTKDAATLYLILSEEKEQQFAESLYMSSAHTEALRQGLDAGTDAYEKYVRNRVKEFAVNIRKPAYADQRAKFALLTALRAGAVEKFGGVGFKQLFFDGTNLAGYTYDSNRVKALLKPALEFESGGYSRGAGWQHLSDRQKKNILFLEVDEIQQAEFADPDQREALLKSLIDNIAAEEFGSIPEFIKGYEEWKPLWEKRASHFKLYGDLSNGKEFDPDFNPNGAAQLQQRLFGSEIDKHFGWGISKGQYGLRSKFKEID